MVRSVGDSFLWFVKCPVFSWEMLMCKNVLRCGHEFENSRHIYLSIRQWSKNDIEMCIMMWGGGGVNTRLCKNNTKSFNILWDWTPFWWENKNYISTSIYVCMNSVEFIFFIVHKFRQKICKFLTFLKYCNISKYFIFLESNTLQDFCWAYFFVCLSFCGQQFWLNLH